MLSLYLFKLLSLQLALGTLGSVVAKPLIRRAPLPVPPPDFFAESFKDDPRLTPLEFARPVEDAETPADLITIDTLAGERIGAANNLLPTCYDVRDCLPVTPCSLC